MRRHYFKNIDFVIEVIASLFLLILSLFINLYAGEYATSMASNSVTDIVLSNIRVFDVDGIFIYGSWILVSFIAILCFSEPKRIPFTVKNIALFVFIRSIFISLTHIGPFPTATVLSPETLLSYFTFGGDLFFSGHTGLPFLLALIYWEHKVLRILFISCSISFGIVVLLAHLHYTIDVLSAFFITYAIYHIALQLFPRDKILFDKGL